MPGSTHAEILATSSDQSWTVSAYASLDPTDVPPPGVRSSEALRVARGSGFRLAASVTGEFRSAFVGKQLVIQTGRHVDIVEPPGIIERGVPTAFVAFGGSTLFRDAFVGEHPGNVPVFVQTVDWLATVEIPPSEDVAAATKGGAPAAASLLATRASVLWVLSIAVLAAIFITATLMIVRRNRSLRQ
jgi:hypothetical protein